MPRHARCAPNRRQLVDQFLRARRVQAAPAGQQQMLDVVPRDQVPGEHGTDPAGAAGDQDAASSQPFRVGRASALMDARELRDEDPSVAHRELGLAACDCGAERCERCIAGVEVDKHEPIRMLGLSGAHEAPYRSDAEIDWCRRSRSAATPPCVTNTSRDSLSRSSARNAWIKSSARWTADRAAAPAG